MTHPDELLPLAYRPDQYDDWGVIKDAKGNFFAKVGGCIDTSAANEHRRNGTDPYEKDARAVVAAMNRPTPRMDDQERLDALEAVVSAIKEYDPENFVADKNKRTGFRLKPHLETIRRALSAPADRAEIMAAVRDLNNRLTGQTIGQFVGRPPFSSGIIHDVQIKHAAIISMAEKVGEE